MLRRRAMFGPIAVAAVVVLAVGATTLSRAFGATTSATGAGTLAATAGCGKAPTLTSGARSIQSSGKNRSFILRIPDNYDRNHPYRLIFGFHWNGGTANDVDSGGTNGYTWSYYGLRELSNNSAIFVAPQGLGNGWANSGGQDLTFVDDMVKLIEDDLCVDTTQLFSLGFSYGGGMSYAIACARATVFRAVAVYSGGQLSGCSGGTQPIAYIGIHGLRDNVLTISVGTVAARHVRQEQRLHRPEPARAGAGQPDAHRHLLLRLPGRLSGGLGRVRRPHTPNPVDGTADAFAPGEKSWTRPVVWDFFTQFQSGPQPSQSSAQPSQSSARPSQSSVQPSRAVSNREPPHAGSPPPSTRGAPA